MYKLFLLFFFISLNLIGQINYEIHYNLSYQIDSNDVQSSKTERMVLDIGNDYSVFHGYKESRRDSLNQIIQAVFDSGKINITYLNTLTCPFKYRIFYDYSTENIVQEQRIVSDLYTFPSIFDKNAWEIQDISDTLNGYVAQKAITHYGGRIFEAWFTNEIPIYDGPYVFKGLPGFVLKVNDTQNYYIFEYLGMYKMPSNRTLATRDKKTQNVNYEKGAFIIKSYREDPATVNQNINAYTANMPEYRANQKRLAALRNNPLEKDQ